MDDFKKQLEAYRQTIRGDRCPLSDQELYRAIRHATWQKRFPNTTVIQHKKNIKWAWVAAAACILVIIAPLTMNIGKNTCDPTPPTLIFTCNTGCDSHTVLARMDNILK
ncbi:MAG: hypothetical protein J5711_09760 [Bacteroidales bacterium]|nr:hypothetical protein [Bacteroidales bacterium]